jgi:hypothetical protein
MTAVLLVSSTGLHSARLTDLEIYAALEAVRLAAEIARESGGQTRHAARLNAVGRQIARAADLKWSDE